jgi:hypothetical protein
VITGSHNWTASAGSINDENTLIIYDHEIANWYYQEYTQRVIDNPTSVEELAAQAIPVFPNPTSGDLMFTLPIHGQWTVVGVSGAIVAQGRAVVGQNELDLSGLAKGAYVLQILSENGSSSAAFLKQ